MLALALTVLLAQGPAPAKAPKGGPSAYDSAKLFFLAGDIPTAQEWARRGLKREPKTCGPLNKQLAEYAFLLSVLDQPTPGQVRSFLALDRQISPTVRGKLTERVYERFVARPLQLARAQAEGGGSEAALKLVDEILFVDPSNPDAGALKEKLAGARKGPPR